MVMIGPIAQAANYRITLLKPSVVGGTELKAGQYDVAVADDKMVITHNRTSVQTAVKTVASDKKYTTTTIRYELKDDKYRLLEIEIGGTRTKLVVDDEKASPGF
jgi:hypothetical protein